jgi:hypothetical protein
LTVEGFYGKIAVFAVVNMSRAFARPPEAEQLRFFHEKFLLL